MSAFVSSSRVTKLSRHLLLAVLWLWMLPCAKGAAGTSCPSANFLDGLHQATLPVRFAKQPSLRAATHSFNRIAGQLMSDAQPFAFEMRFNPWYRPTMHRPPIFWIDGLFANPCDRLRYLVLEWGLADRTHIYATAKAFRQKTFAGGVAASGPLPPPEAEPLKDHPPLHRWTIDMPQIARLMEQHAALFSEGLESMQVTSVARYRYRETWRPWPVNGHMFFFRKPAGGATSLDGVAGSLPIAELIEREQPAHVRGYPTCMRANYLIANAATGSTLETGTVTMCPQAFAYVAPGGHHARSRARTLKGYFESAARDLRSVVASLVMRG